MWSKLWNVLTVVGSIVVVGVLTCCALLYLMWDLKPTQMNVQHSLIHEFMLYKFKMSDNAAKNICFMKDESSVDQRSFTYIARTSIIKQGQVNLKPCI